MNVNIKNIVSVVIYEVILILHFSQCKQHQTEPDKHVHMAEIEAVEGRMVSLPCPLATPLEDVYMILWFRDNSGIPLYSFDIRDHSPEQAHHWSAPEVFGTRAQFNPTVEPPALEIRDIKRHDQGVYRCRIDFRTSQTLSFRFNLSVIILPEQPIVLDRWGRQINGTMLGPKLEGDDFLIICRVVGGRPQPDVRWLVNGLLVDDQCEHNSGDVIENRFVWPSIQRSDLNSVFTCQTLNTMLVEAKETSFVLDMHLKPLTVKIINQASQLVAERRYEVSCESSGSRPNAIITWYKGKRQLRRTKDDTINNATISELSFVPSTDDDGKYLTCRAENPSVNGLFLETTWKLDVVYPPMVTLRLGSTLSQDDIKEGDDVYFECHVQANPQWRKLIWLHNGMHLAHNASARVIRSNQSLVLQKVTRFSAGNYACSAINEEGETVSNQLALRVKYAPICIPEKVSIIGASKDENVEIPCEINADPPARTFRWKFNNSGETLDVGSERFSVNGTRSVLRYTPVTDQDYGTLTCWGVNEVGMQSQPCLFQVVLAVIPATVTNCTVHNQTQLAIEIQCIAGFDGGLPQIFILELYSTRTRTIRYNFTNMDDPIFMVDTVDVLTSRMIAENDSLRAIVYAVNPKGRSQGTTITDLFIGATMKQSHQSLQGHYSPILIGALSTIILICSIILLRICVGTLRRTLLHRTASQTNIKSMQPSSVMAATAATATTTTATTTAAGCAAATGAISMAEHNQLTNFVFDNKDESIKKNNHQKPRWQHTDIKMKSIVAGIGNCGMNADVVTAVDDERDDPDVIPSQFEAVSDHYLQTQWTTQGTNNLIGRSGLQANIITRSSIIGPTPFGVGGSDLEINITAIKDQLMTTRVPESCV